MKPIKRLAALLLTICTCLTLFSGCGSDTESVAADTVLGSGGDVLRIISGSENAELEPILEDFAQDEGVRIEMT